ncbi:conserved hypothetical protein [Rhodococcus phage E3]|uniref:hypothetical protein n=1 Tax=Rhodococcus phage E3 TaxID=1007869 RepID=UPI0002C6A88A|nr:hypothetical protein M176_gp172 [Rhodococcus phage E3]AEQ21080.1 conserved hypothetical protein [Rhodococcus phage E3]
MIVSDLQETLGTTQPTIELPMSDLHIADDGSAIEVKGHADIELDQLAEHALGKHLGVATNYLERCPGDLKASNLNYWLRQHAEKQAVLTLTSTGDLVDVYGPEKRVVPLPRVADIIVSRFRPNDEIKTLHRDDKRFHIDVMVEASVEVAGHGTDWRPEVGDITHGGVRIVIPSDLGNAKPSVEPYLHRLVCSNGWSQMSDSNQILLKGMTVTDILDELDVRIRETVEDLPGVLGGYASLDQIPLPGNMLQTIRTLGQEHNLSPRVITKVMDAALGLGDEHAPTMYDLTQAFTQVANSSVAYGTQIALQRLGGHILEESNAQLSSRCGTCAHLLNG